MSFELAKVVRLRPSNPTLEERLTITSVSNYKGAIGDIRLEVYQSDTDYKLIFIPISNSIVSEYIVKKSNFLGFGNSSIDKAIDRQVKSYARERIYQRGLKNVDADKYYSVIQDPWLDEAPIKRSYGYDPYFLNNGVRINIKWFDGSDQTGGVNWSSDEGSELKVSIGSSFSSDSLIKKIECISDSESFTISGNDFVKYDRNTTTGDDFTGNILDSKLIDKIIETWKRKIPNYDLKLCEPSYSPTITLKYVSPLNNIPKNENSNDIKIPDEKIKLTIVYDKNSKIKSGQDISDIVIYFGEDPFEQIFNDGLNDIYLLDDEYTEDSFIGLDELATTVEPPGTEPDDTDSYLDKGGFDEIGPIPEGLPAGQLEKEGAKRSIIASQCKSSGGGACARYTWNLAKNYQRLIRGKSPLSKLEAAGGNANQSSYYNRLASELSYTKISNGSNVSKSDLQKVIKETKWGIGDVICYWSNDKQIVNFKPGHRAYGHTQMYVGLAASSSGWACDRKDNYGCSFVYPGVSDNSWSYVVYRSPSPPPVS